METDRLPIRGSASIPLSTNLDHWKQFINGIATRKVKEIRMCAENCGRGALF
jgi:hypothetical protein